MAGNEIGEWCAKNFPESKTLLWLLIVFVLCISSSMCSSVFAKKRLCDFVCTTEVFDNVGNKRRKCKSGRTRCGFN